MRFPAHFPIKAFASESMGILEIFNPCAVDLAFNGEGLARGTAARVVEGRGGRTMLLVKAKVLSSRDPLTKKISIWSARTDFSKELFTNCESMENSAFP